MSLRTHAVTMRRFLNLIMGISLLSSANVLAVNLSVESVLGSSSEDPSSEANNVFKRVTKPRAFEFPQDHLAHPDYKTEWWYFSGHLRINNETAKNKEPRFAYQFTLFRFALAPENHNGHLTKDTSDWRSRHIYMAHVALTDLQTGQYYQKERFSRESPGLAGAEQQSDGRLKFWLNNWQVLSLESNRLWPLKLMVDDSQFTLNLQLDSQKSVVLQGDQGLSQKSNALGNASYYYSYTRVKTQGSIHIGDKEYSVSGNSWLDREWSTSSLGADQQGWDWFSLHFEDGSELMLYQMRKKDGSKDEFSSGIMIDVQGNTKKLDSNSFQLKASKFWTSPVSAIQYPIKWQLKIPEHNYDVTIKSAMNNQEWSKAKGHSFDYWEGSVKVSGHKNQQPIKGVGYLEMTGYKNKP